MVGEASILSLCFGHVAEGKAGAEVEVFVPLGRLPVDAVHQRLGCAPVAIVDRGQVRGHDLLGFLLDEFAHPVEAGFPGLGDLLGADGGAFDSAASPVLGCEFVAFPAEVVEKVTFGCAVSVASFGVCVRHRVSRFGGGDRRLAWSHRVPSLLARRPSSSRWRCCLFCRLIVGAGPEVPARRDVRFHGRRQEVCDEDRCRVAGGAGAGGV